MSHRSRLSGFIIDCETGDMRSAATFWGQALGLRVGEHEVEGGAEYVGLQDTPMGLHAALQKVSHPSRIHLDIEADDQDAEAARLEVLGARRIGWVKRWWVMEAPTGHRFCIVKMNNPDQGPPPTVWG
ncbi:VOC family protein [Myxococcus llanfairpwllgwyngyllgogerychwyrndrobwllllantysiliogogogochensis]|uniref:VOC family protein n=1 Tax=Myxococcus llanfairpwllgwyngyllgogerychwyrndrobwllllantysiliogogogochensis TaxID=2590453 RepID=A0A540WXF5_9BACT|nr:VOC family protein [Myxococcus llanfairpwllgwyngyllgogerychwyrndrobwllllantysiliogogogochensis]TQF13610.1 VOC family protein [Myxococcus llanfairpwllgwyngyllgogerychwyrndrobwllllantysiliogogogochensis]